MITTGLMLAVPLSLFYGMSEEMVANFGGVTEGLWQKMHGLLDHGPAMGGGIGLGLIILFAFVVAADPNIFACAVLRASLTVKSMSARRNRASGAALTGASTPSAMAPSASW